MLFHNNIINSQNFSVHHITQEILKLIESLRSSLSKNAMIAFTEMIPTFKKQLDPELEAIIMKLIKKGMDTNCFILDEVRKGLISVCQNCSEARLLPILFNLLNQKSPAAKLSICICFEAIIEINENKVTQLRDFERMLLSLATYMIDNSFEVRNASKKACYLIVKFIISRNEIDKILQRNLSEQNFLKVIQIFDRDLSQFTENPAFVITNSQSNSKKSAMINSIKGKSQTKNMIEEVAEKSKNFSTPSQIQIVSDKKEELSATNLISTIKISIEPKDDKMGTTAKMKSSKMSFFKEGPEFENLSIIFAQAENTGNSNKLLK